MLVLRRQRGEVLAVERVLGDAGARIAGVGHLLEVLQVPAHPVLGAEERGEDLAFVQHVGEVAEVRRDAGWIEDGADAQPLHRREQLRNRDHQ